MITIAEATSTETSTLKAAQKALEGVERKLLGARADLAFLFISHQHAPELEEAAELISKGLNARHLIGCTAEAVIGGKVEHEGKPAISLWAAALPMATIRSSQVLLEETADGHAFLGIPEIPDGPTTLLLLPEPFSFPTDDFLLRMHEDHPSLCVIGGMASAARGPGENRLFLGEQVLVDGAVAVVISGPVRVRPIVSQGCRPFGKPLVITKADRNFIRELGGKSALTKLSQEMKELSTEEREMLQRGLNVGIAIDASKQDHRRGDFLVRNVIGFSREDGSIAVADLVRPGTTIQFHLRDAATASEDLEYLLQDARTSGFTPKGALLFSCNGRGKHMFNVPSHDAACFAKELGDLPLAGFFAAGEIGPVGGQNFLHGFTASLALFEEPE